MWGCGAARIRCGSADAGAEDQIRIGYVTTAARPPYLRREREPFGERSMVALISLLFLFVFCVGYQYSHFHH